MAPGSLRMAAPLGLFLSISGIGWPSGAAAWDDDRVFLVTPGHGHHRKIVIQRRVIVAPPPVISKVIIIDRRPIFFHHPRPVVIIPSPLMSISTPPTAQPLAPELSYVVPPPPPTQTSAYLRLDIKPDDTEVYLNGRFLGTAQDLRGSSLVAVTPGKHLLELRRLGSSITKEIDLPAQTTMIILQDWTG